MAVAAADGHEQRLAGHSGLRRLGRRRKEALKVGDDVDEFLIDAVTERKVIFVGIVGNSIAIFQTRREDTVGILLIREEPLY